MAVAYAYEANMYVFAVSDAGKGVPAVLTVDVVPGHGDIDISIAGSTVGEDTQLSVRRAVAAATSLLGVDKDKYDYRVRIEAPAAHIDGPSAGLPIALCIYAALQGKDVPDDVGATGDISADGYVGPVGGIFEKVNAAADVNIHIFLIPAGERNTMGVVEEEIEPGVVHPVEKTVDIVQYAMEKWGMRVYEVKTLKDAVSIVFEGNLPEINAPPVRRQEEFVPPPVSVNYSEEFNAVVMDLYEKALKELNEVNRVSCQLYDQSIVTYLDALLRSSRSRIAEANKLMGKGYLYTVANHLFLAVTGLETYKLICEHPALIDAESFSYGDLYADVAAEVHSVEQKIGGIPLSASNFEFLAGARERLIRAEATLERLKDAQGRDPSYVYDLITAKYWAEAAKQLASLAPAPEGNLAIASLAREYIKVAEDTLASVSPTSAEQGRQRLEWAKLAYQRGWFGASILLAAEASGLAQGDALAGNNPLETLPDAINSFVPKHMWSELYYNHARYYYYAARHYSNTGFEEQAMDTARTALQLLFMAKSIDTALDNVQKAGVQVSVQIIERAHQRDLLLVVIVALVLALIFVLLQMKKEKKRAPKDLEKSLDQLLKRRKKIRAILKRAKKPETIERLKKELSVVEREIRRIKRRLKREATAQ